MDIFEIAEELVKNAKGSSKVEKDNVVITLNENSPWISYDIRFNDEFVGVAIVRNGEIEFYTEEN